MSRTRIKEALQQGRITINGVEVTRFDHPIKPGDRIEYRPARRDQSDLPIVFEDEAIVVVDKPPGLLTVATASETTNTAFVRLRAALQARRAGRPFVVHRLDRETSGLLLFAKSATIRDRLQANWDCMAKTYLAVVEGEPRPAQGMVDNYLIEGRDLKVRVGKSGGRGKRALTRFRVVRRRGPVALLEVELLTGRKHQIRVHLAGLGCPVIGDRLYGSTHNPAGRLGLHAWRLAFDHPVTGRRIELESPLPPALRRVVGPADDPRATSPAS